MPYQSKGIIATLPILGALLAFSIVTEAEAQELHITNRAFGNVPVVCSVGYAYQTYHGGDCSVPSFAQQSLDGVPDIGWIFTESDPMMNSGSGITNPNSGFDPPPFSGLLFAQAAFLRGTHSAVSQVIGGFIAGNTYQLNFYLGSRYYSGPYDGNQTVGVSIDNQVIGSYSLQSYAPFTLRIQYFRVSSSGAHVLKFVGLAPGDHTAFLSGVSINSVTQ